MKNQIIMEDISFAHKENVIFSNLCLNIKQGDFITILGSNGSGKTSLSKILDHKIKCQGKCMINAHSLVVSSDSKLYYDTLREELEQQLLSLKLTKKKRMERIEELVEALEISHYLDYSCHYLSDSEYYLFLIIRTLIAQPEVIILDDILSMLCPFYREKVFQYLKKLNREKKISIINITTDSEDSVYGKEIAFLSNQKILNRDKMKIVLSNEKFFIQNNIEYPFMADLSLKLKYYGLVEELILKDNKMVDLLWK